MLIRSKIKREGGTVVPFGKSGEQDFREYHFKPDEKGEHVAEVADELDQKTFLAITEGYEEAAPKPAPKAALPKPPARDPAAFLNEMDRKAMSEYAADRFPAIKLDAGHSDEQVRNYLRGLITKAKE